ncbi:MAG: di-trans,poly-cis-decaprenylcistransferase, partial [Candidatus Magasanikbacteria bacterium]|nr:di-trans,poly-cis-decaprenylcistransferase [Candidatus Magasanikbacteria bacterium]
MPQTEHIPQHLAIILDGNRRWAAERGLPKLVGHTQGAKNLRTIAKAAQKAGVKFMTVYALSTENLKERSPEELKYLFELFGQLVDYLGDFVENNAQLRLIGNIDGIPAATATKLRKVEEATKNNTAFVLTISVNYGGRDEITRAVKKITAAGIPSEEITEALIGQNLDTVGLPDVDLLIRTGGHHRLSNFLSWQSTYAELYFV